MVDANYVLTAEFIESQPIHYTLDVDTIGSGTVNATDNAVYDASEIVVIAATESPGWIFSNWLLNSTYAGSTNPLSLVMDSDFSLTAVFIEVALKYSLNLGVEGLGSVIKSPDQILYDSGTIVELTAIPDSGYVFSTWTGAITETTNPAIIIMDSDKTVFATFMQIPVSHLFEDDFESGNLIAWDGQESSATVSTDNPYQGTYHLSSRLSSGVNNGWSGLYKSVSGTNPINLTAAVFFDAPPNTNNEDQWALAFTQSTAGNALAYAGLRQVGGTPYWSIWYISSGTTLTYAVSSVAYTPGWHNLELAVYRGTANDGWVEFYVDGVLTCSAYNLDNDGRTLNYARVGFSYSDAPSSASSSLFIDNVTIDYTSG